ncbi:MAG TPA: 30S ribosomal protein S6 [Candidatus Paceibacterota bacterium]|nr:30S ribosomal protein S6 [Candidatus Paceibacterota bacterium]
MARKNDAEMKDGETMEDVGGSRVYELGFHLDPELPQEEVKKTYQQIHALVEEKGALVAEGEPQKIPLAYRISRQEPSGRRDFDSAFFGWIAYETSAENHEAVLLHMKGNSKVVRFIDLVTTKDAARHSAEMHEINSKVVAAEPVAASDAELDAAIESAAVV